MFQKEKGVLLILLGALLLLELVAILISFSFAVQLVLLSAAAAVILRFLFVDAKEQETKRRIENYMRRLR
jgi:membrane protein implicated in regulation of membrane protease activity